MRNRWPAARQSATPFGHNLGKAITKRSGTSMHCNVASEQSLNVARQVGVVTVLLPKSTTISGATAAGGSGVAQPTTNSGVVRAVRRYTALR
jgi:hypothetical protein